MKKPTRRKGPAATRPRSTSAAPRRAPAASRAAARSFLAQLVQDERTRGTAIEVPFDPKALFGKVRAPVIVTIGEYSYRSTIAAYGGRYVVPLRREHREAAGVSAPGPVRVTIALDEQPRTVTLPPDLAAALRAAGLRTVWDAMPYTHQREYVEAIDEARKAETRQKRIAGCVELLRARPAPRRR